MKKTRKLLAILLVLVMSISLIPTTVFASNSLGVTYAATLDVAEISPDANTQTVVMTVKANQKVDIDSIQMKVLIPDGWTLTSIANEDLGFTNGDVNFTTGAVVWFHPEAETVNTDILIEATYTVPANVAVGEYTLGVDELKITYDYGTPWETGASAKVTLTVAEEEAPEVAYTATLNKTQITSGAETQTVVMTVKANQKVDIDSIQMKVLIPDGWTLTSIANEDLGFTAGDANFATGAVVWFHPEAETVNTDMIIEATYTVPANVAVGEYTLGVKELKITSDYGTPWESDGAASVVLNVKGAPAPEHVHADNLIPVEEEPATCTEDGYKAYYECSCGEAYFEDATGSIPIDDLDAWLDGDGKIPASGHTYEEEIMDERHLKHGAVDCLECNTYWYNCVDCDANAKDDPEARDAFWVSDVAGAHSFKTMIEDDAYLVEGTGETCQEVKEYYYACEYCGEKGEDSWRSNTVGDHNFIEEIKDDAHYVEGTGETCQGGKEYYFDCLYCDEMGEETWESDEVGDHVYGSDWKKNTKKHWNQCVCGDRANEEEHYDLDDNDKCDVCGYNLGEYILGPDEYYGPEVPSAPSVPSEPSTPPTEDIPQTGDNSMMWLWIVLLVVCGAGVAAVVVVDKKRNSVK